MAHLLLIDDDQRVLATNAAALASGGHTHFSAGSAEEARRALSARPPDMVIVEPLVPGSDGSFGLVKQIAADYPDLPIIVLTRADDVLSRAARDEQDLDGGWLPAQRFMEKPVAPAVLRDEVDHLLHELHGERQ